MYKINGSTSISTERLIQMMEDFKHVFDIVRLVDSKSNYQFKLKDDGELEQEEYFCYAVWNKGIRCSNCISAKCLVSKEIETKFEFVDNEIYFVMSKYVVYKGEEYTMEMVKEIKDNVLFSAYGKNEFADRMNLLNDRIYRDALTGAFNRRYYDEQSLNMTPNDAMAIIDLDHFKELNDTFGHSAGDMALKKFAEYIKKNIRDRDKFIRYGGDEFIIILSNISREDLEIKLNRIRCDVANLRLEGYPQVRLSVSIGGTIYKNDVTNLFEIADEMLYIAKKKRNCVQVYD